VEKGISARWSISFATCGNGRVLAGSTGCEEMEMSWATSEVGLVDAFVNGSLDKAFHVVILYFCITSINYVEFKL
jgi:hypothetical protein